MPNDQLAFIVRDVYALMPVDLLIPAGSRCRIVNSYPNDTTTVKVEIDNEWKSAVVTTEVIAIDTMDCMELLV